LHTKIREILIDPYAPFRDLKITQAEVKITTEAYLEIIEMCTEFALGFGFEGDEDSFWSTERIVDAALRAVELARQPTTTIDFADMIFLPLVHNWVKPVCDLLVVDEAQDLSEAQLRLAIAATRKEGRICICGDDRQAIYGFRGADSGSLDRLKAELGAAELGLKTTYRCPQEVVALAQKFVPDFYVAPTAPRGDVLSLLGDKPFASAEPGDFVLSRTNADLISVCLELIGSGKKAYVKGSEFARDVRKLLDDLITNQPYLKLSLPALTTALEKWYESECEKSKKLKKGVALKKLGCVTERRNLLAVFIKGSENYRDLRVKIEATFVDTPDPEAIMCATVHKAKGLEAPNVFLLGNTFSRESSEEENICYVAMTRAKEILYIVGRTKGSFVLGGRISRDDVSLE
jgi:DNA helicase-2/ATP-dependent DNA helicase PcrA